MDNEVTPTRFLTITNTYYDKQERSSEFARFRSGDMFLKTDVGKIRECEVFAQILSLRYDASGTGKAFCDGMEEDLKPGVMHICPQGSEHSIVNTGEEDLVMLTIVVKK